MQESTQHKLDRVRPPRVQITYDVEIGDAIVMKELPFVGGILADLSGTPAEPLPKMRERKFVEIDRDNFNEVLAACTPRLAFRVPNRLKDDDTMLNVELNFAHIDDFTPVRVAEQVEPLRRLLVARQRLVDLLGKLDGNDRLETLLQEIVHNTETLQEIKNLAASGDGASGAEEAPPEAPAE